MDVAVVGSLHLDIMVKAPRLPQLDETLFGSHWHYKCGGKGGNQAQAAAQFGAKTAFGGQTGIDDFGDRLRENLKRAGVDISCVEQDPDHASGMSVAITEANGEYGAVVVSGANLTIAQAHMEQAWKGLWQARVLLLQNEIPEAISLQAAKLAKAQGGLVILNAAPARPMTEEFLDLVDVLVVNRVEAAMLSGEEEAGAGLLKLTKPGRHVVLTRGSEGLIGMSAQGERFAIEALPVQLLSSHGAGDCFCGALAARLAQGDDFFRACQFASIAAGLIVSTAEVERGRIGTDDVLARLNT